RRTLLDALIDHVVPACRIAGVGVGEAAGDVRVAAESPGRAVEPHAVALDRAAHGHAAVPAANDRRGVRDAVRAQRVVHVVALRPLAGDVAEERASVGVATGLGHQVERGAATIGLAEAAGHRHLHFGRPLRVVAEPGHAATVERRTDVHTVDL